jgi:TRAP-type C4-dicarboxylate transport system substrate-binding protein
MTTVFPGRRLAVAVGALTFAASLAAQPVFRISLENNPQHVQVKAVQRFADSLARRTAGALRVEVYPDGRLFRDRDVVSALVDGKVEMAVPGTWQLDRYEPAVGIYLLPPFYGRERSFVYQVASSPLGREIEARLARSTGAVVLGRWIDLGPVHLLSVRRPITRTEDIAGMRVRIAGGVVNELRLRALGASPLLIAWTDLPARITQGAVDGVLTSFETVASARLWEAGVRYAFEDSEYFGQYVPLVSPSFWARCSETLRDAIRASWDEHVDEARDAAAEAQREARAMLLAHGVRIVTPSEQDLAALRGRLAQQQAEMVRQLGVDATLASLIPSP